MVIESLLLQNKRGIAQMRKQLVFLSLILMAFFLNACVAAIPIVAGGATLTCVMMEEGTHQGGHGTSQGKERCWALEEIDERIKEGWIIK